MYTTKLPTISRDDAVRAVARVLGASAIREYTEFWIDDNEGYPDNFPDDSSRGPLSLEEFSACSISRTTVRIRFEGEYWQRLETSLGSHPIAAIAGGFAPNGLSMVWGPWVVYGDGDEGPEIIATSMVCFEFFSWGCPADWPEYRRRILEVPELGSLYEDFQAVVGPLRVYAGWHV